MLDLNVWVILILMTGVAGFTMISGLLIIILERTNMIGVLKALGADNLAIRKIFLSFSVFLIGRGMLWGNLIGLALIGVQEYFRTPVLNDVLHRSGIIESWPEDIPAEAHALELDGISRLINKGRSIYMQTLQLLRFLRT